MEEKKEKPQNYQTWIDLSQSIVLRKPKKFMRGPIPLVGGLQHISPTCHITQLNQASFNQFRFAMLAFTVMQTLFPV